MLSDNGAHFLQLGAHFLQLVGAIAGIPMEGRSTPRTNARQITANTLMKHLTSHALGLLFVSTTLSTKLYAANLGPGYVDFGKFAPPAAGGEFVEINVGSNLISMVTHLTQKGEPDVAELLRSLQLIRVNVIGLNDDNRAEIGKRVQTIREELDAKGWQRVVIAQKKNEDVGIYLKTRGEEAVEGVVVTVMEGKREAVLINIVGDIKPEKLGVLGERFNIEPLKKIALKVEKHAAAGD